MNPKNKPALAACVIPAPTLRTVRTRIQQARSGSAVAEATRERVNRARTAPHPTARGSLAGRAAPERAAASEQNQNTPRMLAAGRRRRAWSSAAVEHHGDLSAVEDHDVVGDVEHQRRALLDQHDRQRRFPSACGSLAMTSATICGARPSDGSSISSTRGLPHQGAADRQHLLLAAGQMRGDLVLSLGRAAGTCANTVSMVHARCRPPLVGLRAPRRSGSRTPQRLLRRCARPCGTNAHAARRRSASAADAATACAEHLDRALRRAGGGRR